MRARKEGVHAFFWQDTRRKVNNEVTDARTPALPSRSSCASFLVFFRLNAAPTEALFFAGNVSSGIESRSILLAFRGTFRQKIDWVQMEQSPLGPLRHPSTMAATRPFEGVRVLELGTYLAAPLATLHLAGLGASVCAVVRPDDSRGATSERGAWLRLAPPQQATTTCSHHHHLLIMVPAFGSISHGCNRRRSECGQAARRDRPAH